MSENDVFQSLCVWCGWQQGGIMRPYTELRWRHPLIRHYRVSGVTAMRENYTIWKYLYLSLSEQFHLQRCDHRTERGRCRDASLNSEQCVDILNTHKTCSLTIIVNVDCVTKNDAKLENIDKDIYLGVHINMWLRKIYRYLRRLPNKICDIIFFSYWSLI